MACPWLTPGVRGIGLASLLSDLGHEIPTALLPSFVVSTLGAPAAVLGLIEGVADALSEVAKVYGGALADDPGRRRTVAIGGYTLTAVLSALIGVATAVWQVAIFRTAAWTARGTTGLRVKTLFRVTGGTGRFADAGGGGIELAAADDSLWTYNGVITR